MGEDDPSACPREIIKLDKTISNAELLMTLNALTFQRSCS
jgi:hypothetical protein